MLRWPVLLVLTMAYPTSTLAGGAVPKVEVRAPDAIAKGGAAVVFFRPEAPSEPVGIRIGSTVFPAFPVPTAWPAISEDSSWCRAHPTYQDSPLLVYKLGQFANEWRFSLVAYPIDARSELRMAVQVKAGDKIAEVPMKMRVLPRTQRAVDRQLSKRYLVELAKKFRLPADSGSLLSDFVTVNRTWRQDDTAKLAGLASQTANRFLWSGPFLVPMAASARPFGEIRRYSYKGKLLDSEAHQGYDLAAIPHAWVPAVNDGVVVFKGELRVYGKCIVVDHGFGLQSIYGHLSEFSVEPGERVRKGAFIGRKGASGFTEGEILHLGLQINGVAVDARQWWDEDWLRTQMRFVAQ